MRLHGGAGTSVAQDLDETRDAISRLWQDRKLAAPFDNECLAEWVGQQSKSWASPRGKTILSALGSARIQHASASSETIDEVIPTAWVDPLRATNPIHDRPLDFVGLSGYAAGVLCWIANLVPECLLSNLLCALKYTISTDGTLLVALVLATKDEGPKVIDVSGLPMTLHSEKAFRDAFRSAGLRVDQEHHIDELDASFGGGVLHCFTLRSEPPRSGPYWPAGYLLTDGDSTRAEYLADLCAKFAASGDRSFRSRANHAIALDALASSRASDPSELVLATERLVLALFVPPTVCDDYDVHWSLGTLLYKVGRYHEAVTCLRNASLMRSDDYRIHIRLAYCYEALEQFEDAICTANRANQLLDRSHLNGEEAAAKTETLHALGHFHAGASHHGRLVPDETQFLSGLKFMLQACQNDKTGLDYVSCVGSMFSERSQHQLAIFWFDWALSRLKGTAVDKTDGRFQEVIFYRALALLGAGDSASAEQALEEVARWAHNSKDWDAVAHAALYRARCRVARGDVRPRSRELQVLIDDVLSNPASQYVVASTRRDRHAFLAYLRGLSAIDVALNAAERVSTRDRLSDGIKELARATHLNQGTGIPISIAADFESKDLFFASIGDFGQLIPVRHIDLESLLAQPLDAFAADVLCVFIQESLTDETVRRLLYFLGQAKASRTPTILYCERRELLGALQEQTIEAWFADAEEATLSASLVSLYMGCKKTFSDFHTPLGLAPIWSSPARLATQTVPVPFLGHGRDV